MSIPENFDSKSPSDRARNAAHEMATIILEALADYGEDFAVDDLFDIVGSALELLPVESLAEVVVDRLESYGQIRAGSLWRIVDAPMAATEARIAWAEILPEIDSMLPLLDGSNPPREPPREPARDAGPYCVGYDDGFDAGVDTARLVAVADADASREFASSTDSPSNRVFWTAQTTAGDRIASKIDDLKGTVPPPNLDVTGCPCKCGCNGGLQ